MGKTTLIQELGNELRDEGETILFFNLDIETDFAQFSSQERLLNRIRLEVGASSATIFIDEIQRKENAGLFLKGLYDMNLPYKWVVTGSGSLELKEKIHESLFGRKRLFELFPVSLSEFMHYRTQYRYPDRLGDWAELENQKAEMLLLEYLNFGGYPRVVTAQKREEKQILLEEIFRSYLERDIIFLLGIEKTAAFTLLIRLLADRAGQGINYSDLAKQTGLSTPTLKKYIWYAEKTFVLRSIVPFFRNVSRELVKAPQIYFSDLGLMNFSIQRAGSFNAFPELGFVFQNLVLQLLLQRYEAPNQPVKYWRTKSQAEVDFILERGINPLPIEVKCRRFKERAISKGMRSFLEKYKPDEAWIINLSLEEEAVVGQTTVKFIPWYRFALGPVV